MASNPIQDLLDHEEKIRKTQEAMVMNAEKGKEEAARGAKDRIQDLLEARTAIVEEAMRNNERCR